jgi:hypothetical protein
MLLRDLNEEESKSYEPRSHIFNLQSFSALRGRVTEWAIIHIAVDWKACKQAINTDNTKIIANIECSCEFLLRFSLPYKHYLLRAYITGIFISTSLFHFRWWLSDPPISKALIP